MPKGSILQLRYYSVDEIHFKDVLIRDGEQRFELHPKYTHTLTELENKKYDFTISVKIETSDQAPAPFELYVAITGHFKLHESDENPLNTKMKDTILKQNTAAILFPFLRSIVSTVTANANVPALMLPVMNFAEDKPDDSE